MSTNPLNAIKSPPASRLPVANIYPDIRLIIRPRMVRIFGFIRILLAIGSRITLTWGLSRFSIKLNMNINGYILWMTRMKIGVDYLNEDH
jgi:hypothetical protein